MTEKGGIPDVKMIRSPESKDQETFSSLIRGVNQELTKVHRNQAKLVIVPVAFDSKKYYLLGTVYDQQVVGHVIKATLTEEMCFCPFARLLDMEEWKQVLTDSGERLRYCTPVKDMLYDPYKICQLGSERPFFRFCTVEGRWKDKPVDLLAAYSGSIYTYVGSYVPFALILPQLEIQKIYQQGKKDIGALAAEFEKDKEKSSTEDIIKKLDDYPDAPPDYNPAEGRAKKTQIVVPGTLHVEKQKPGEPKLFIPSEGKA